jgi:hypothetical protein
MPYVLCYNDRHQSIPLAVIQEETDILGRLTQIVKSTPIKELVPFKDTVFHTWSSNMNSGIVPFLRYSPYKNVTVLVLDDKNYQTIFVTRVP